MHLQNSRAGTLLQRKRGQLRPTSSVPPAWAVLAQDRNRGLVGRYRAKAASIRRVVDGHLLRMWMAGLTFNDTKGRGSAPHPSVRGQKQ